MEQNYNNPNPAEQNPVPQQNPVPNSEPAPQQPYQQAPQQPYQQPPYQPPYQQPVYQQPYQQPYNPAPNYPPVAPYPPQPQAPAYPYYPQPKAEDIPGLKDRVDSAFGKALASVIMAGFPVASIIAIVMGSKANNLVSEIERLAAQYGVNISGKKTAAKIMGKIGFFAGIGMTVFRGLYVLYFIIFMGLLLETNYHF